VTGAHPGGILIAGGGTAGHVLPGVAVADALVAAGVPRNAIVFVGAERGVEGTLVPGAGYDLVALPGRGIRRSLTLANVGAVWGLVRAAFLALRLVRRRRPAVVLSLGGYASAACTLAAVLHRVPVVVAEQNASAGVANRLAARFAAVSAVPFPGVDLPRAVVTGNPVRPAVAAIAGVVPDASESGSPAAGLRREARAALGVDPDAVCVAAFSGSLGARRVNEAVVGLARRWAERPVTLYHVSGRRDHDWVAAATADLAGATGGGIDYRLVPYEDHMEHVLAASDLAVTRSGGTTVAELATVGLPAVVVPLPGAPRDHQRANAAALVTAGGAVLVNDDECTPERLDGELAPLLGNAGERHAMARRAASVGVPDAAGRVAGLVLGAARSDPSLPPAPPSRERGGSDG
jgi:undecaprenyldiphospho-muramoylpentapeptide beta-N-acetylglucosaminyltransferase